MSTSEMLEATRLRPSSGGDKEVPSEAQAALFRYIGGCYNPACDTAVRGWATLLPKPGSLGRPEALTARGVRQGFFASGLRQG